MISAIELLVRYLLSTRGEPDPAGGPKAAEHLLAERDAHRDIDDDEYQRRLTRRRENA